jgi:N-hydroxyarylamine O-acetyltransferase
VSPDTVAAVDIAAALARIGIETPVHADLAGLRTVHQAWAATVPYENFDIQLGVPLSLAPEALLDKLITRRRGGFCYEVNATLALLLRGLGFQVSIVEAAVDREFRGETAWRNHMPLLVEIEQERWIADVGLVDALLLPLPLRPGTHRQGAFAYDVLRLDDDVWQVRHHPDGAFTSFDLRTTPLTTADFEQGCTRQATSPESMFVQTVLAGRAAADHTVVLRARTLAHTGPGIDGGRRRRTLASADEFADVLGTEFHVPVADIDVKALWAKAEHQHEAWLRRPGPPQGG